MPNLYFDRLPELTTRTNNVEWIQYFVTKHESSTHFTCNTKRPSRNQPKHTLRTGTKGRHHDPCQSAEPADLHWSKSTPRSQPSQAVHSSGPNVTQANSTKPRRIYETRIVVLQPTEGSERTGSPLPRQPTSSPPLLPFPWARGTAAINPRQSDELQYLKSKQNESFIGSVQNPSK